MSNLFLSELRKIFTKFDNFGKQMTKTIKLCEILPISISRNLCQRTTVLKADAPNCCIMLSCCAPKGSNDLVSTQKCDLFSKIMSLCNNLLQIIKIYVQSVHNA